MQKTNAIPSRQPLSVIQVFRNAAMFQKGVRTSEAGRDWLRWPEKNSQSGYLHNGALHLPEPGIGYSNIGRYSTVLLLDDFSEDNNQSIAERYGKNIYGQPAGCINFSFLQVKPGNPMAVYFNGGKFEWLPKRQNYKLCELQKNNPVEIKINGKSDGYHQRYYMEEQFILEYLGDFSSFKTLPAAATIVKQVPAERKIIDLRALLW